MKYPWSHIVCLLMGLLVLCACERQADWELHPEGNGVLAVDALLTNEFKTHEITLSKTFDLPNETPPPAVGAMITLEGTPQPVSFLESTSTPGVYISERPFLTQRFIDYQLEILWEGESYSASNDMKAVGQIWPIAFTTNSDSTAYRIDNPPPLFDAFEQSRHEVLIDWSHLTNNDASQVRLIYYTLNTIDVNQIIQSPKEPVFFPKGSIATITKYSLNDDYAEFIRALLMETQWQGGVYDEASSSLPTNFSNGAVGYFGVSAVRTEVKVVE